MGQPVFTAAHTYKLKEIASEDSLKYFFVSKGLKDQVKAVEFILVGSLWNRMVFNLGFGDYNFENDDIDDFANSNNGDTYRIFQTVLSTVPYFFRRFPDALVIVRGSDSSPEFQAICRQQCVRGCFRVCRKVDQRINIYLGFVNKHYAALQEKYSFGGGRKSEYAGLIFEEFTEGKKYDAIIFRKKVNLV